MEDNIYIPQMINILFHLIMFALTCLSIAVASTKARLHLAWLIPMALAWFFQVCIGGCQLAGSAAFQHGDYTFFNFVRSMQMPMQILSVCNIPCWLWAGVALLIRLQAIVPGAVGGWKNPQSAQSLTEDRGTWPPAPTPPTE